MTVILFIYVKRIEDMLKDFQQHLSSISSDIQSLQQQSIEMNVQLKNKQAVRSELSQYVDEMVVPEVMIRSVNLDIILCC